MHLSDILFILYMNNRLWAEHGIEGIVVRERSGTLELEYADENSLHGVMMMMMSIIIWNIRGRERDE